MGVNDEFQGEIDMTVYCRNCFYCADKAPAGIPVPWGCGWCEVKEMVTKYHDNRNCEYYYDD